METKTIYTKTFKCGDKDEIRTCTVRIKKNLGTLIMFVNHTPKGREMRYSKDILCRETLDDIFIDFTNIKDGGSINICVQTNSTDISVQNYLKELEFNYVEGNIKSVHGVYNIASVDYTEKILPRYICTRKYH